MKRADGFESRPAAQIERLRSGQACAGCRKGKNRCDGARPRCNYCLRRNIECDYPTAPRKSRVSPGYVNCNTLLNFRYVNSLEEKIRRLESRIVAGQTARLGALDTTIADEDFPLSPSSEKDTFENQQPVEVIEFGNSFSKQQCNSKVPFLCWLP
jgi:hypothetical protein